MPECAPVSIPLTELERIYSAEYEAAHAIDPEVVRRKVRADALRSEVFLVGQALGRDTQRLSGLPYVFPGGPPYRLSKGGAVLDRWLEQIGYTIRPHEPRRRYAYHADLHAGFPGKAPTSGDVVPSAEQIEAGAGWLRREIELVRSKAIIALGKEPALDFLRRYANITRRRLGEVVGQRWKARVGERDVLLFAAFHPSGAFQFTQPSERAWEYVTRELADVLAGD